MRDISEKIKTLRTAIARSEIKISPATIELIKAGKIPKGDPLEIAKVAAIQAAKNTSSIIPYCHPLPIDFVGVEFELSEEAITVEVTVKAIYKTGVEMEALTAAAVATLTLYDMMKMLDEPMELLGTKLLSKTGGKSDFKKSLKVPIRAAVLVISDSIASGKKTDEAGQIICAGLKNNKKLELVEYKIIPDTPEEIEELLVNYCDQQQLNLVITSGGTGVSAHDNTPEVTMKVIEREIQGIEETARAYGQERTPYSMLSRGRAGVRGKTLIINFPGSKGGAADFLDALIPGIYHVVKMLSKFERPKK